MAEFTNDNWAFRLLCAKIEEIFHSFQLDFESNWTHSWANFWVDVMEQIDDEHANDHDTIICEGLEQCHKLFRGNVMPLLKQVSTTLHEHRDDFVKHVRATNDLARSTLTGVTHDMFTDLDEARGVVRQAAGEINSALSSIYTPSVDDVTETVETIEGLARTHAEMTHKRVSFDQYRDLSLRSIYQRLFTESVVRTFLTIDDTLDSASELLEQVEDVVVVQQALREARAYAFALLYLIVQVHNQTLASLDLRHMTLTTEQLHLQSIHTNNLMEQMVTTRVPTRVIHTEFPLSLEVCSS